MENDRNSNPNAAPTNNENINENNEEEYVSKNTLKLDKRKTIVEKKKKCCL